MRRVRTHLRVDSSASIFTGSHVEMEGALRRVTVSTGGTAH